MAPKLCPISCATTCHWVRPAVETAVPDTNLGAAPLVLVSQLSSHVSLAIAGDVTRDLQGSKPGNAYILTGRATTHEMPKAVAILAYATSPLREKRKAFAERCTATGDVPRELTW